MFLQVPTLLDSIGSKGRITGADSLKTSTVQGSESGTTTDYLVAGGTILLLTAIIFVLFNLRTRPQ